MTEHIGRPITPADWKGVVPTMNSVQPQGNYKVIRAKTSKSLVEQVNASITAGWTCLGGVSVLESRLYQAMHK